MIRIWSHTAVRMILAIASCLCLGSALHAQSQPACTYTSTAISVHSEGLAEPIGDLRVTCTGGTVGATASLSVFVALNTQITNRLDSNGNLSGLSTSGWNVASIGMYSGSTLLLSASYTITAGPTVFTLSGLRAAVASINGNGAPPAVTYALSGLGAQFTAATPTAAIGNASLLASNINGVSLCNGSLPGTQDFFGFAGLASASTVRVTEATNSAFNVRSGQADTGFRILVRMSGLNAGTRIFVPDAIVGYNGTMATSAGAYNSAVSGGFYTPTSNQLLLIRVSGADQNGAGGYVSQSVPFAPTQFTSVSEVTPSSGVASVTYEVVDSNPATQEFAQVPVFVIAPSSGCVTNTGIATTAQPAPVSNVAQSTMFDPIPRFITAASATDCMVWADCSASYFPSLVLDPLTLNLSGKSLGSPQLATVRVLNSSGSPFTFSASIAYPVGAASGWLSATPLNGAIELSANPASLQPGTYTATLQVNAGTVGVGAVPVTFTVGAPGVTIENVGNAASFAFGSVSLGSYAAIFGKNLGGTNVRVTFNGFPATVIFANSTQINVLVPANLAGRTVADVIVVADAQMSNTFTVRVAPNVPGIFTPGIVNVSDSSVNTAVSPATKGTFVSVYLTGLMLPLTGAVTVNIGDQLNVVPVYAGAQPTLPALDQVNVLVPAALAGTGAVKLSVCVDQPVGGKACSNQVDLYVR